MMFFFFERKLLQPYNIILNRPERQMTIDIKQAIDLATLRTLSKFGSVPRCEYVEQTENIFRPLTKAFDIPVLTGYVGMYRGGAPLQHVHFEVEKHRLILVDKTPTDPDDRVETEKAIQALTMFRNKIEEDMLRGFDGFDQSHYNV